MPAEEVVAAVVVRDARADRRLHADVRAVARGNAARAELPHAAAPELDAEERVELVKKAIGHLPMVEADAFDGLLVKYVEDCSAQAVVRGLRAVSDFEFEFQLALMNRKLNEKIETIFMMPKDTYTFLSSRIVKEIARLGGDVSAFVPAHVQTALKNKLSAIG